MTPPNFDGGGGRYFPSMVVVAPGEPGVPVVCCARPVVPSANSKEAATGPSFLTILMAFLRVPIRFQCPRTSGLADVPFHHSIGPRRIAQLLQGLLDREAARLLARRELLEAGDMLRHDRLRRNDHEGVLDEPAHVVAGFVLRALERVGAQVE